MDRNDVSEIFSDLSGSQKIYQRGNPFYRLTHDEETPRMTLNKNFNTMQPKVMDFLNNVDKNQWSDAYTDGFLIVLSDVKAFAKKNEYYECKTAALYEIFYSCFKYYALLPALSKDQFTKYFRETLILYSIKDPPERLRIFTSIDGFAIAKLFQELVVNNFEMMRFVLLPAYEIEVSKET